MFIHTSRWRKFFTVAPRTRSKKTTGGKTLGQAGSTATDQLQDNNPEERQETVNLTVAEPLASSGVLPGASDIPIPLELPTNTISRLAIANSTSNNSEDQTNLPITLARIETGIEPSRSNLQEQLSQTSQPVETTYRRPEQPPTEISTTSIPPPIRRRTISRRRQ